MFIMLTFLFVKGPKMSSINRNRLVVLKMEEFEKLEVNTFY